MRQKINEEVSVVMAYSAKHKKVKPYILDWKNKVYYLDNIGYYHSYMEGRDRQHIFELVDREQTLHFRIRLDSSNLHWTLETIHDGLAD